MLKISVLVSGGGTNFQSVIDAVESGFIPDAKIVQVISSSPKAYALERAKKHGIPGYVVSTKAYPDPAEKADRILSLLREAGKARDQYHAPVGGFLLVFPALRG